MGSSVSVYRRLFLNKEMRILMLGLDAAGKTSNAILWSVWSLTIISHSIQIEIEPRRQYYTNCGVQRRDGDI